MRRRKEKKMNMRFSYVIWDDFWLRWHGICENDGIVEFTSHTCMLHRLAQHTHTHKQKRKHNTNEEWKKIKTNYFMTHKQQKERQKKHKLSAHETTTKNYSKDRITSSQDEILHIFLRRWELCAARKPSALQRVTQFNSKWRRRRYISHELKKKQKKTTTTKMNWQKNCRISRLSGYVHRKCW